MGDELPGLQARHAAVLRFFQKVRDKGDLDQCVAVLEPEDTRAEFEAAFRRFGQSMDMVMPDPKALPYYGDLKWLGKVRQTARARFQDPRMDISDCGEKVRKLIEEAIVAAGIEILVRREGGLPEVGRGEGQRDGARHPGRDPRPAGGEPGVLHVPQGPPGEDHRGPEGRAAGAGQAARPPEGPTGRPVRPARGLAGPETERSS